LGSSLTNKERFNWVKKHFRYSFQDLSLLDQAFTHRSFSKKNNERLEFLGDSLLSFSISRRLYASRLETSEGDLSRYRSELVKGITLSKIAKEIDISKCLILGSGAASSGGGNSDSVLACTMEAILGAIYIDGGYEDADRSVGFIFNDRLMYLPDSSSLKDSKTKLQEALQREDRDVPVYKIKNISGAEHKKKFIITCEIERPYKITEGIGHSKKVAEQKAAESMILKINNEE
tara:strand:- start:82470 stop:83168 length:699 start_codon:yes stop_codon:yes gene_type:complete